MSLSKLDEMAFVLLDKQVMLGKCAWFNTIQNAIAQQISKKSGKIYCEFDNVLSETALMYLEQKHKVTMKEEGWRGGKLRYEIVVVPTPTITNDKPIFFEKFKPFNTGPPAIRDPYNFELSTPAPTQRPPSPPRREVNYGSIGY